MCVCLIQRERFREREIERDSEREREIQRERERFRERERDSERERERFREREREIQREIQRERERDSEREREIQRERERDVAKALGAPINHLYMSGLATCSKSLGKAIMWVQQNLDSFVGVPATLIFMVYALLPGDIPVVMQPPKVDKKRLTTSIHVMMTAPLVRNCVQTSNS